MLISREYSGSASIQLDKKVACAFSGILLG